MYVDHCRHIFFIRCLSNIYLILFIHIIRVFYKLYIRAAFKNVTHIIPAGIPWRINCFNKLLVFSFYFEIIYCATCFSPDVPFLIIFNSVQFSDKFSQPVKRLQVPNLQKLASVWNIYHHYYYNFLKHFILASLHSSTFVKHVEEL